MSDGVDLSFIGAGQENCICSSSDYSAIVTGKNNSILDTSRGSFIGAGNDNSIDGQSNGSFIGTGYKNNVSQGNGLTVLNGTKNTISNSTYSSILNGGINDINYDSQNSIIAQGKENSINSTLYGAIINGTNQTIGKNSNHSIIGGGKGNSIFGGNYQSILNGKSNVHNNSDASTIVGGTDNYITQDSYSIIGGGRKNTSRSSTFGFNVLAGGFVNYMCDASYSSILGGTNNYIGKYSITSSIVNGEGNSIVNYTNAHIIGSNINAYANNSTFVENLYVAGNLSKITGTFRIPYPGKNTFDIVHSLVETNTPGDNIYRYSYTTPGEGLQQFEVFIPLPEYFPLINDFKSEDTERPQVWVSPEGPFNFFNANAYIGISKSYPGLLGVILNFEPNQMINRQNVWATRNTFNILVVGTRSDKMAVANWNGDVVPINAAKQIQERDRGML